MTGHTSRVRHSHPDYRAAIQGETYRGRFDGADRKVTGRTRNILLSPSEWGDVI